MKTTLDLPDELFQAVKLRAVSERRTVTDIVAELLRQGLGMVPPVTSAAPAADSTVEIGPQGLPVIRCQPDAPAKLMSAMDLLQLEQSAQGVGIGMPQ